MWANLLGKSRTELLHDMIENRTYAQLKDLVLESNTWNQDSRIKRKSVTNRRPNKKYKMTNTFTYITCAQKLVAAVL